MDTMVKVRVAPPPTEHSDPSPKGKVWRNPILFENSNETDIAQYSFTSSSEVIAQHTCGMDLQATNKSAWQGFDKQYSKLHGVCWQFIGELVWE